MKLYVIPNSDKPGTEACLKELTCLLNTRCAEFYVDHSGGFVGNADGKQNERLEQLRRCDAVLALGGDGTIIHAAKLAAELSGKPILGINTGRFGFTSGIEASELHMLDRLLSGDNHTEYRMMLDVSIERSGGNVETVGHAINDAVIFRDSSKIIDLSITHNDRPAMHYRADGVIAATPTGSTGYSLSAGGPIIDPGLEGIALTPVCPHSLNIRPMIFSADSEISILPEQRVGDMAVGEGCATLSIDGEPTITLYQGDRVIITRSEIYAEFIVLKTQSFAEAIWIKFTQ